MEPILTEKPPGTVRLFVIVLLLESQIVYLLHHASVEAHGRHVPGSAHASPHVGDLGGVEAAHSSHPHQSCQSWHHRERVVQPGASGAVLQS